MVKIFIFLLGIFFLGSIPNLSDNYPFDTLMDNNAIKKKTTAAFKEYTYANLATPNLTFDSYSFNQNCSVLNVTFCNTGSIPYEASEFYLSFYDANPIESTIDRVQIVIAKLNDAIEPGECFQIKLFNGQDLIENKLSYGFINNNNTSDAPFDFENDFPNTGYAENNYLDNLIELDFSSCLSPSDEICNNLIDDDGDGLIDAFDPDCECNNEKNSEQNYVQNPGFEEHSGCCSELNESGSCVNGWNAVNGSPDYYGLDCIIGSNEIADLEDVLVTTFDNSFLSSGIGDNSAETIGSCLINPLLTGKKYSVELMLSHPAEFLINLGSPIEFALYGFSDPCPDFSTLIPSSTINFCESSLPEEAEELISVTSNDIQNLEFNTFTSEFIPTSDINYIILALKCDDNNQGEAFIQIGYVQIYNEVVIPWKFNEEISVTNPCDNSVSLSVPFSDTMNYQWYQDSIPMPGEVSSNLEVARGVNGFSEYHVKVHNENGCILLGPAIISLDNCNAPNFSFDFYEFNQDCATLSISFCNTGSVPYEQNAFFITLYDVNPLENISQMAYHLVVNLTEDIEPGECFATAIFKIDAIWNANMLYGFINDNNSTSTPFDLLNDFPSTGFNEIDYQDNLFLLDFSVCDKPLVEICNNLIDDDGDGLIDIFDPECECNNDELNKNYVRNPGFEEHTVCCSQIQKGGSCVDHWEAVGGTADYYGLECSNPNEVATIEEVHVTEFDNSFISLGTADNFSETVGACLIDPLIAGETYVVESLISFPTEFLINLPGSIEFKIYGFSDECPDFATILGSSINFCDTSLPDQAEELISINSNDILNLEFKTFTSTFTPSSDINYIVLSLGCNILNKGETFIQLERVQISDLEKSTWEYNETISISNLCAAPISLSVPFSSDLNYQWFRDSIPLSGEISPTLEISETDNESHNYHVFVYHENGCALVGPAIINPVLAPPTLLTASVCEGVPYTFGDEMLTISGTYFDTLTSQIGCDSIIELSLTVSDNIGKNISMTICEGETYLFGSKDIGIAGIYYDTLANIAGCDIILILNLEVKDFLESSFQDSFCVGDIYSFGDRDILDAGVYNDTLKNNNNCDSIITLTLFERAIPVLNIERTICEDETYFFKNTNLSIEGIYSDTTENSVGCDSVYILDLKIKDKTGFSFQDSFCFGEFYSFGGREIIDTGVYYDTLQNSNNCDSIITVTLKEKVLPERFLEWDICDGDEIRIGSETFSKKGYYSMILKSENSCDTILNLSINVQEMINGDTVFAQILEGELYLFNDEDYEKEGLYEVIIPSFSGCDSLAILSLSINKDVYIPNVFSTSSTVGNDHFKIYGSSDIFIRKYRIFDRWGNIIFTSQNFRTIDGLKNFWDGYSTGNLAAKGVYIYYIEYELPNGASKQLTGSLTVI